jgi:hypothetical protein
MSVASDIVGRMDTGQKASAVLHLGLVAWVALFDLFQAPSRDMTIPVAEVSLMTAEEFAALSQPQAPAPAPQPEPTPAPTPAPAPPAPEPEPEPEPEPAPAPEPESTGAIFSPAPTPGAAERPAPRPVDRVAPTPTEAPPEDAAVDETAQPQAGANTPGDQILPEQEQVAPPEATTEIVTEATETDTDSTDRAAAAPTISQRPRTRPERPAPPVETAVAPDPEPAPAPEPEAEPTMEPEAPAIPDVADDVADAVAAALADSLAGLGTPGPTGLTGSEADALRLAIQQCWNIGVLSTEAQQITITVAFSLNPSAIPDQGSIRTVDSSAGSDGAVSQAFEAARRAIIRCAGDGYGLPPEKYEAWRNVEITFNPEGMRLR